MMQSTRTLASTAAEFPNFKSTAEQCVIFCEFNNQLLLLPESPDSLPRTWELPGGNIVANEQPITAAVRLLTSRQHSALKENSFARWAPALREFLAPIASSIFLRYDLMKGRKIERANNGCLFLLLRFSII